MREHKYRVWDNEVNCMLYFDVLEQFTECDYEYINKFRDSLAQYTGLKDKNGKEIYEGDIVKQSFNDGDLFAQVVWSEFDNGFITLGIKDIPNYPLSFNPFYVKNAEVIGNIYENKELLND